MRHRGGGTHGDCMASQIELVHSAHGLSRAGRFRLRLGVFVQSGSLNSVVVVTHAGGRAIGELLVSSFVLLDLRRLSLGSMYGRASTMRSP